MSLPAPTSPAGPARLDAEFFERLFEGAGLAIFACDLRGVVRAMNARGEDLLRSIGRGDDAAVNIVATAPDPDRPKVETAFRSCISSREPQEVRTRICGPTGCTLDYAVWFTPVVADDRSLEGICVWFHDITARLAARESLRKSERLSSLGAMSGAVAHHYSNLLCSIGTSLGYAMSMNTLAATRRALERTSSAVGRATELTRQLLAFAKADFSDYDLADLVESVLFFADEHEERFAERGVRLELQWQPIPMIPVPREQIQIIFGNIVENALEAMPNGGTLHLSVQPRSGGGATISVCDTGPGIRPEQLDKLFEPFYTTKGELVAGGARKAGMGLAVVYGLVSELGGSIQVENVPEGGAKFTIQLPPDAGDGATPVLPPTC